MVPNEGPRVPWTAGFVGSKEDGPVTIVVSAPAHCCSPRPIDIREAIVIREAIDIREQVNLSGKVLQPRG